MQFWQQPVEKLLKLFLNSPCPLCQRPTKQEICENCIKQLYKCQLSHPNNLWHGSLPLFAWGKYGGILKRAIATMKYDNHPEIGYALGRYLGESWLLHSPLANKQLLVVPIPMYPEKEKQRGFNQATLIAQGFCEITGLKLKRNGLKRVRSTEAQFGLSFVQREKNLSEAFAIGEDFRQRPQFPVILVDDIYTTGATAKSAVQTFRQTGIAISGMVTVAAAAKAEERQNSATSPI
ncbi:ComF family protein [Calothrix sp. 336/3]|uniref:ComF family protein n=1 Tax=Calothrix sp. 336/3 TaxID=1337936 RepID=UPI0004E40A32|nr:ComF family protein [Calothrix sp. 336/3]AKG23180.1 alpha-L-fucosidase [Calothrix sp. 336/3]